MKKEDRIKKINIAILFFMDQKIYDFKHKDISRVTGFEVNIIKRYMKFVRECEYYYNFDLLYELKRELKLNRILNEYTELDMMYETVVEIGKEYVNNYITVKWAGYKGLKSTYDTY